MITDTTSKNIGGISDLVILAKIEEGFIDAFENITYEARLKLTAEALHKVRVSAREYELIAPFPDTAERILSLLDFRIGFLDDNMFSIDEESVPLIPGQVVRPRRYMYLVATFDGPWEPYMRLIYKPLGPFLDLLLCNCEGYPLAQDVSFADYTAWVRAHQIDSSIFYATTGLSVRDQNYLAKLEKVQREHDPGTSDRLIAGLTHDFPETQAEKVRWNPATMPDAIRLGFEALTVLFRLADYYPADDLVHHGNDSAHPGGKGKRSGEGRLLLAVGRDLLKGWWDAVGIFGAQHPGFVAAVSRIYAEPLAWFFKAKAPVPVPANDPPFDPKQVQTGILEPYDRPGAPITHGALLMMQISDPTDAQRFLKSLPIDWGKAKRSPRHIFHNIAFTFEGLKRLGINKAQRDAFPKEFREGSVDRAPLIGDIRENHPRRWRMPQHNWSDPQPGDPSNPPVDLSEVDFVIQLRRSASHGLLPVEFIDFLGEARAIFARLSLAETKDAVATEIVEDPAWDPLAKRIAQLALEANRCGVTLLTVESTMRPELPPHLVTEQLAHPDNAPSLDHFGFVDGISQPVVAGTAGASPRDIVKRGDLLRGYANGLEDAGGKDTVDALQFNGSFLVIRKMPQDRQALEDFIAKAKETYYDLTADDIAASLVGRRRDGTPLIPATGNDFDFTGDPHGQQCPLASHIRRTNPRDTFQNRPSPRILRRGMTYGSRYTGPANAMEPRGVLFMAYNASIAEQYEVIQRWINRGNSTGIAGAQNDPLVGISAEPGPRTVRFVARNEVRRLVIDKPFVGLEWTMYCFVPAKAAFDALCQSVSTISSPSAGSAEDGAVLIRRILSLEGEQQRAEWKRLLEDFLSKDPSEKGESADLWAAIRDSSWSSAGDEVLSIPEGVASPFRLVSVDAAAHEVKPPVALVGTWRLIEQVLSDPDTYSVCEQGQRVARSFGDIFVAMDPGRPEGRYEVESKETNEIIWDYSKQFQEDAFQAAYRFTEAPLNRMKRFAAGVGRDRFKLELRRELLMPALGSLCAYWFDIPDFEAAAPAGQFIELGGWGWDKVDETGAATPGPGRRKARCPGDFMAPSRYSFYPEPTSTIQGYGEAHGRALKAAAKSIVAKKRKDGNVKGKISLPMYSRITDPDLLARNLIGIMEGMLPPTDGILRGILYEWLDQDTLWRHQGALHRASGGRKASFTSATAALLGPIEEAMCKRPAPDLIYRTTRHKTELGGVELAAGTRVILGLVSAMQELNNVEPVFGGYRRKAQQDAGTPTHACPAMDMVMASVMGVLSALLDSGRITAQPASLIVEISEYPLPAP